MIPCLKKKKLSVAKISCHSRSDSNLLLWPRIATLTGSAEEVQTIDMVCVVVIRVFD